MAPMNTPQHFRPYQPGQFLLLPPDTSQWLPEGHLAYFVMDVVESLDLSEILDTYDGSRGGQPAYHPSMMVALLLYSYCVGVPSSRRMEKGTYELIPLRVIAAGEHPDHATISEFRRRHLKALGNLFLQSLVLCREAGLVKLGHVALDGTKMRANASKHKAMSYGRMEEKEKELEEEVKRLLAEAEAADAREDDLHGKDRRGDELPEELRFRGKRLKKIKEAKRVLENRAQAAAAAKKSEADAKAAAKSDEGAAPPIAALETTGAATPGAKPEAKAPAELGDGTVPPVDALENNGAGTPRRNTTSPIPSPES